MTETPALLGTVIRKDGTVPFDDDVTDDMRAKHLGMLVLHGHKLEPVEGTKHFKIKDFKGHPPGNKAG
jgi:hypothetical protein